MRDTISDTYFKRQKEQHVDPNYGVASPQAAPAVKASGTKSRHWKPKGQPRTDLKNDGNDPTMKFSADCYGY